jgi:hypothetical protein
MGSDAGAVFRVSGSSCYPFGTEAFPGKLMRATAENQGYALERALKWKGSCSARNSKLREQMRSVSRVLL